MLGCRVYNGVGIDFLKVSEIHTREHQTDNEFQKRREHRKCIKRTEGEEL